MVSGVETLLLHEFPEAFDEVEVRRVGRQELQLYLQLLCAMPDHIATLVARIVQKDRDRFFTVKCAQFQKHLANALGVDVGVVADGMNLQADGIQCAQNIPSPPPARRGD